VALAANVADWEGANHEWGISMAAPAIAAAASVPMSAAWTNGIDLRNTRRIDCSLLASC